MNRKLKNELITLSWLLPKCKYAIEHCDDVKLLKMRFNQLCKVNDRILKYSFFNESEVTEDAKLD